jgi:hypothetical protein
MIAKKRTGRKINSELTKKVLRTVHPYEAFLFFTDIGKYTGESAPSLEVFLEKLNNIPLESIEFHFRRGDFEKWIRETLEDEAFANRISKIDRSMKGEELRTTIQRAVKRRLGQLKATATTKT